MTNTTKENKISIKRYEQAADPRVSLGGIQWEKKWDVCVQCNSLEEAEALRKALAQPEPAAAPPQRTWVGLTDEDLYFWGGELGLGELGKGVLRAVDAHLREKNT